VTDRSQEVGGRTKRIAPERHAALPLGSNPGELIDRIERLRTLLPEFAQETATARREAARLRSQNTKLQRRLAELEARFAIARELQSRDA
jgi:hypothetical protein